MPTHMSCLTYLLPGPVTLPCRCRQSKGARAAAAAVAAWNYAVEGPPDVPLFDATAEASAAVAQLLGADVVLTTYDVLQQVRGVAESQLDNM